MAAPEQQEEQLVLCSGTLRRGVPFAERVEAAARAGFAGISLWGRDYAAARAEGLSDEDLRLMVADHGLFVAELDPAWWWLPGAAEVSIPASLDTEDVFRFGESDLFALADTFGARSLNAVDVFGGKWSVDDAAEAFAGLCERADEHGLLVHLEWLPWSKIPDLATAADIVRLADRRNGGLNVDSWHLVRAGDSAEDLAKLPAEFVLGVQLDDGPATAEADLLHATLHDRRLPGEGEFDLTGIVAALRATDSAAPIGVEVFSDALHELPASEAARLAAESTRRVLREAG
jgi:sugar phosphate isomerase/epimerase